MTVREDLAAAASTVDGVTAHPYFVQSTKPGHTFIRLERIDYPNPFGGICHWNVVVVLPQDTAAAEQYVEEKVPLVRAAIGEHAVVTSVVPQRLDTGSGVLPVAFINCHREEE